jgi:TolB protein
VVVEATALPDRSTKAVSQARWRYISSVDWMPEGTGLVVTGKPRSSPEEERGQIWYVPFPEGEAQKITNDANNYYRLTLTADARTALVLQSDFASNVWVAPAGDFARVRQITNSNSEINEVCWTADGRIIYSGRTTGRQLDLWVMNADGTGNRQLTFSNDLHEYAPGLSPDGRQVVFMTNRENLRTIWRMGVEGGAAKELVRNVDNRADPHVSPDSQWVYYNSRDETGNTAFWKVPFDGGQPVKVREQTACRLSPDGKWFLCVHRDPVPDAAPKLLVVPSAGGDPVRTFDPPKDATVMPLYWSPDGQAFDFIAERDGIANVWRLPFAGGREQKLTDWPTAAPLYSFTWSRDGRTLALTRDMQKNDLVLIQNFR